MPSCPPLRVMYVEDDRIAALLLSHALRAEPRIALRVAEDLAEALALAAQWQPQALVIDAHLPDGSGHELLAQLRTLPGLAEAPAFMCSADATVDDRLRAHRAGFDGFWAKPVVAREAALALLAAALAPTAPG